MRVAVRALLLLALALPAPADAQDVPGVQSMRIFHGTCQRLVTPEGDQTKRCNSNFILTTYASGRHSFWFSIPKVSLISFSGAGEGSAAGGVTLQLDHITTGIDPKAIHAASGAGTCTFSDPSKGVAHVACSGSTADGTFVAEFTTDGKPPQVLGSD